MKRFVATAAFAAIALGLNMPALRAQEAPLLKLGVTVKIPDLNGSFDFLKVDAVHHRLLCAHEDSGTAEFIGLGKNTLLASVPVGHAVSIALDKKLEKYFISCSVDKNVAVVDAKTFKQTGTIKCDTNLDDLIYEPTNDRVYVTHDNGSVVWIIDPNTEKVVGSIPLPGMPEVLVYDKDTDRIYLNLKNPTDEMITIDPKTNTIVEHWSTKLVVKPHGLAFDRATGRLYAAGVNEIMAIMDSKTGKVIETVKIDVKVDQNAFDPVTRRIYCACQGFISVVQDSDQGAKYLGHVKSGDMDDKNVAFDTKTNAVWACYTDGKDSYAQQYLLP